MNSPEKIRLDSAWLDAHWMPFTGNRQFKANPRMFVAAEGAYLIDAEGKRVFDGLSGLWCAGLGHCRREIVEAVQKQVATLDYAPAFQFGHPASFALANKIKELTPAGLDYVFFTGSGSESADTSLKMARAYWRAKGQGTKTRLIGREKGYHGVNFGGISVGGIVGNRKTFGQGIEADHLPHTQLALTNKAHAFTRGQPTEGAHLADELLRLIALHDASNIAAVIVEPFAGSAGVIIPPKGYLQRLRDICTRHDILLIFDEVISGFGRMGSWTASEEFGVTPDMLNFAKQMTNGTIPMGGVVATSAIYEAFMAAGGPEYMLEFPHGYTYSAHPVACAAGLAALDLLDDDAYALITSRADCLAGALATAFAAAGITAVVPRWGSLVGVHFGAVAPHDYTSACTTDETLYARFFHAMLDEHVAMAPGAYEVMFPGLAHDDTVLTAIAQAAARAAAVAASA